MKGSEARGAILQIYDNDTARKLTLIALEAGVRNFFASVLAGNQKGFAQAIKESGIPREELYICGSVVSNRAVGTDKVRSTLSCFPLQLRWGGTFLRLPSRGSMLCFLSAWSCFDMVLQHEVTHIFCFRSWSNLMS